MTKQEILKELNKGNTYKEVGKIAENLLYKLCPLKRDDIHEGMFNYLNRKDLESLGYDVYEIETSDFKKLEDNLKKRGYLYTKNVFFSLKNKEIWSIDDYNPKAYVCMDYKFLSILEEDSLLKLISNKQYIELLANKIMGELERWNNLKNYFNSLVKNEKDFYERELNEEKKAEIIKQALEKAKKEGLIK